MDTPVVLQTRLPAKKEAGGPVYESYDLGEQLLIVATDRLSLVDAVFAQGIPLRGQALTSLSAYWYQETTALFPGYFLTTDLAELPASLRPYQAQLAGRSLLARKTHRLNFSCLVRGYLNAPAWREYEQSGTVGEQKLPVGLRMAERLPEPIVTPLFRAPDGRQTPTTQDEMKNHLGEDLGQALVEVSQALYAFAATSTLDRGIIIADTRIAFGLLGHQLLVIDELLTPDSSRLWAVGDYAPGKLPPSFDKQLVMEYLAQQQWKKSMPLPSLPAAVIAQTSERYRELLLWLTGIELGEAL